MFTIYVQYTCHPGKRAAFIEKMKQTGIVDAIRAENGCAMYDYYLSEKDPDVLLLIEQWASAEHQKIHMTQPHMAQMKTFKNAYVASTAIGELELK